MTKRTYGFDEYQKLVKEGIDEINFRRFHPHIEEHEEETTASIDDLGEGSEIATGEEAPAETEATEEVPEKSEDETVSTPIDTGNSENITDDEVKVKYNYINQSVKNFALLLADTDKVKIDDVTKKKIVKLYNFLQSSGI